MKHHQYLSKYINIFSVLTVWPLNSKYMPTVETVMHKHEKPILCFPPIESLILMCWTNRRYCYWFWAVALPSYIVICNPKTKLSGVLTLNNWSLFSSLLGKKVWISVFMPQLKNDIIRMFGVETPEEGLTEPTGCQPLLTQSAPGVLQPLDLVLDEKHRHCEGQNRQQLQLGRHRSP